ncbi:MAG: hypothetical protein ACI9CA_000432 [Natronomonas sp.]|jgi:hypothetical protein
MESDNSASQSKGGNGEVNREQDNVLTETERTARRDGAADSGGVTLTETEQTLLTLCGKLWAGFAAAATVIVPAVALAVSAGSVYVSPWLVVVIANGGIVSGVFLLTVTGIVVTYTVRGLLRRA